MEMINILIATKNQQYAHALARGLLAGSRDFSIRLYRGLADMEEEEQEWDWDICLTDNPHEGKKNVIFLSEEPTVLQPLPITEPFQTGKYQKTSEIGAYIRLCRGFLSGRPLPRKKASDSLLLSVASCLGGAGCTTVAMGLAREYKRFAGKRVLYLNMEEFSSSGMFFRDESSLGGLGMLLYGFMDQNLLPKDFPEAYLMRDQYGVCSFRNSNGKNPLRTMAVPDFGLFLTELVDAEAFDVIVADCGNGMDGSIQKTLSLSDRIVFLTGSQQGEQRKKAYFRWVKSLLKQGQKLFLLPVESQMSSRLAGTRADEEGMEPEIAHDLLRIPYSPLSFRTTEGCREICMDLDFGEAISEIGACILDAAESHAEIIEQASPGYDIICLEG